MSSKIKIDIEKRYYCEVLNVTDPIAGTFMIGEQGIIASLVRFNTSHPYEIGKYLYLRTEENWYPSMFNLVPLSHKKIGGRGKESFIQNTLSNITVIGRDSWAYNDKIHRLTFRIPGLDSLFQISPHFKKVMDNASTDKEIDLTVFQIKTTIASIKVWLQPSISIPSSQSTKVVPLFKIEFTEGQSLENFQYFMTCILRFFSILSGKNLHANELVVSRYTEEQFTEMRETRFPMHVHHPAYEHFIFRHADTVTKKLDESIDSFKTLVSLFSTEDRVFLEESLTTWIANNESWAPAFQMMVETLSLQGEVSASRLLSATRCLEEIPIAKSQKNISSDHVTRLGEIVSIEAKKLNYNSDIAGRFKGAISRISSESNRERLTRLSKEIKSVFGEAVIDEYIVDWVAEALSMRGRVAHGAFTEINTNFDMFLRALYAIECFNLLLIAKDLPLGLKHQGRIIYHPLVEQYRSCKIQESPKTFKDQLNFN
ncbi:MAG: hypothetical protein ABF508_08655 [Zymomonas mobilis]|uniref:ApeA N-terminal domain 1-containing protein n=1 Tax=Zymomonas mobilis TaxID=542 RepID=UPI0039E801AB